MEKLGGPIEFENENSELANDLNKQSFTRNDLSDDSYYIATRHNFPYFKREN